MQISRIGKRVIVTRDPGDPRISNESNLWYKIRNVLLKKGEDVIKKRMWKDGHMVDDNIFWVRSRKYKPGSYGIYDPDYAVRNMMEEYNYEGRVTLSIISLLEGYEVRDYPEGPREWTPRRNW